MSTPADRIVIGEKQASGYEGVIVYRRGPPILMPCAAEPVQPRAEVPPIVLKAAPEKPPEPKTPKTEATTPAEQALIATFASLFKERNHRKYGHQAQLMLLKEPCVSLAKKLAFDKGMRGVFREMLFMYYFDEIDPWMKAKLARWMDQPVYYIGKAVLVSAAQEGDPVIEQLIFYALSWNLVRKKMQTPEGFGFAGSESERLRESAELFVLQAPTPAMVHKLVEDADMRRILHEILKMYSEEQIVVYEKGVRNWLSAPAFPWYLMSSMSLFTLALTCDSESKDIINSWPARCNPRELF